MGLGRVKTRLDWIGLRCSVVGYNVQVAVDTEHHLIITHEVTNSGSDRAQLANIASQAKSVLGVDSLEAIADRGYFSGGGNPGMRPSRNRGDASQTDDIRDRSKGPLRQAGLCLSHRGGCASLSGW
jgi:hypothetical protein